MAFVRFVSLSIYAQGVWGFGFRVRFFGLGVQGIKFMGASNITGSWKRRERERDRERD